MSATATSEFQFDLSGGHLALDLANSLSRRHDPVRRKEHLGTFLDVVSFFRQSSLLSPKDAQELREYAMRQPAEARRSFAKIVKLREAIYRVFAAIAQRKPVAAADVQIINDFAVEALGHRALAPSNRGYGWEWLHDASHRTDWLLWPVAKAAADLLTSGELPMLRFCEAPDCEWLFLDHSRNRSRRWCDMKSCGNRAKARRHYERTHE